MYFSVVLRRLGPAPKLSHKLQESRRKLFRFFLTQFDRIAFPRHAFQSDSVPFMYPHADFARRKLLVGPIAGHFFPVPEC
jgi:hypothetical protein